MRRSAMLTSLIFSGAALVFSLASFLNKPKDAECSSIHEKDEIPSVDAGSEIYLKGLLSSIKASIRFSKEITQQEGILSLLDEIENRCVVVQSGNDELRVKFVTLQGSIEHALACSQVLGEIVQLIGIIHTPTPATPLCTKPDQIDAGLLDESIRYDMEKLLTIRSRAQIVREYLLNGGKLYVVYPEGGLEKRTPQQQNMYTEALHEYAERLIDWKLPSTEIDPDSVGAAYLFKNQQGQVFAFSIKSRQANDPQDQSEWGIWFGPIDHPIVEHRINTIFDYLNSNEGPDLRAELL